MLERSWKEIDLLKRAKKKRSRKLVVFALLGCMMYAYTSILSAEEVLESEVVEMLGSLEESCKSIRQTISDLQGMGERRSWEGQASASRYIQERLRSSDLRPEVHKYERKGQEWENVSVTFPGHGDSDSRIVAVAHYDSTSRELSPTAPGADDNATGVAALLEIARMVSGLEFEHTVQLVFFSNEEHGRQGSKAFAKELREKGTQVKAVLNVDIVGYNNPTDIFSKELFRALKGEFPWKRKVKMIGKMIYNLGVRLLHGGKVLKVVARNKDKHLFPNQQQPKLGSSAEIIKWIVDDDCI